MPAELNGRRVLVTGGASGIGAACAAAFAAAGAAVTVADLDERGVRKVAEPLGGTAVGVDLADQARVHGIPESEVIEKIMLTEPAVKRLVEPAEVANLAVLLCSQTMSFANGGAYPLDGGWTAR